MLYFDNKNLKIFKALQQVRASQWGVTGIRYETGTLDRRDNMLTFDSWNIQRKSHQLCL
jgi:hypothetical protein